MKKKHIAFVVAAAVLAAGVVAGRERPALELVQERAPRAAAAVAVEDGIDLEKLNRGESSLPQTDPFKNFAEERAPVKVSAPEKPVAPPLPFQYFGRLTEGAKTEVFVMRGDELISIAAGQKLGEYRVDQVSEATIAFTYLPLKTRQTLELQ
jgi:hypothetical protein